METAYFTAKTLDKGISKEIAREGYKLNRRGIQSWLVEKKILIQNIPLLEFIDETPWHRSGGETFSATFSIKTNQTATTYIMKALVTMNPEKSLEDWARRRSILEENQIPVSNWVWIGNGTIIEPFYPHTYREIGNFNKLVGIAFLLDRLGFNTLQYLEDIRGDHNGEAFYIDFGFDLGEPSKNKTDSAKTYLLKKFPSRAVDINNYYNANL